MAGAFGISVGTAHAYVTAVTGLLAEQAPGLLKTLRAHEEAAGPTTPPSTSGTACTCRSLPTRLACSLICWRRLQKHRS